MDRASYYLALDGVTRYGLVKAVARVHQNALGHPFFPWPSELRGLCDKAMEHHKDMARLVRLQEQRAEERRQMQPVVHTEQGRARVSMAYQQFLASHENAKADDEEARRAEVRSRYGMTPEVLASIKDNPAAHERMGVAGKR